jgi:hypothetical protein
MPDRADFDRAAAQASNATRALISWPRSPPRVTIWIWSVILIFDEGSARRS